MKKTLLSAAIVLGFAGAANAQTSVTLYGVVDGGFGYTQFKDKNLAATNARAAAKGLTALPGSRARKTGLHGANQSANVWGLRGEEDLGGGLRAGFHLESGWDLLTGRSNESDKLFDETAMLSLSGDAWGTLGFGRQVNFASQYAAEVIAPQGDDFALGHVGASFSAVGTAYYDNMVSYETPEFSGFQLGLGYSFHADGSQPFRISGAPDSRQSAFTSALRYSNGPLTLVASYDQLNRINANVGEKDVKAWVLGASYDFDVATLHLGFGQERNGTLTGRGDDLVDIADDEGYYFTQDGHVGDGYKANTYSLGISVPLESSTLAFGWQSARLGSSAYKNDVIASGGKRSQNLYTLLYTYDLSKRTSVYAFANYGTGFAFNDVNVTQAIVGLRHNF